MGVRRISVDRHTANDLDFVVGGESDVDAHGYFSSLLIDGLIHLLIH